MEPGIVPPAGHTSFIGRDEELAKLAGFLECGERLVTIVGFGGVGKTRVARELYNRQVASSPMPHFVVSLDSLEDAELVLPTIASALGLREAERRSDLIPRIASQLRNQPALLLLDSLEHLLDAAPEIHFLHDACPGLTILATSRSPLQVAHEQVVPLDPFKTPDQSMQAPTALIWANPAVRLFVDRARSAGGEIHLGDTGTLAEIVRRVEGMPLAIELAAARMWQFRTADALLNGLDWSLSDLDQGYRDGAERHQSMHRTIDWSYRLLSAQEQALFARLAVCVGGFDLELATRLSRGRPAGGPYLHNEGYGPPHYGTHPYKTDPYLIPADQLDYSLAVGLPALEGDPETVVESLTRNNLIRRVTGLEGTTRYVMYDKVREFGLKQLEARGETAGTRHTHAIAQMALAEISAPLIFSSHYAPWPIFRLDDNQGNLRSAITWAESHKASGAEIALRIVDPIWQYFQYRGQLGEVRHWLQNALVFPTVPPVARGFALGWLGLVCWIQGDDVAAKRAVDEAIQISRKLDLGILEARALAPTAAAIAWRSGDLEEMGRCIERALPIYQAWLDAIGAGICLFLQGQLLRMKGDPKVARQKFDQAYDLMAGPGYTWGMATTRYHAAEAMHDLGDRDATITLLAEALALYWRDEDGWGGGSVTTSVAVLASERNEMELAARFFGIASTLLSRAGAFLPPTQLVQYAGVELQVRGALREAFTPAYEAGRALDPRSGIAEVRAYLGGFGSLMAIASEPSPTPSSSRSAEAKRLLKQLTPKEHEAAQLYADNDNVKEIADSLGRSYSMVNSHIKNAAAKIAGGSKTQLAHLVKLSREP